LLSYAAEELLEPHAHDGCGTAFPLQLIAAVHRLVLEGHAPELAPFYLSAGGSMAIEASWEPFRRTMADEMEALRALVKRPVRTNDPGRSGSLGPDFCSLRSAAVCPCACSKSAPAPDSTYAGIASVTNGRAATGAIQRRLRDWGACSSMALRLTPM
jgi:hypothetical protein